LSAPLVLVPSAVAESLATSGKRWGHLGLAEDKVDDVWVVRRWSDGERTMRPVAVGWSEGHYLAGRHELDAGYGLWYRGTPALHDRGLEDAYRRQTTPAEVMQTETEGGWKVFKRAVLVVTFAEREGETEWAAWIRREDDFGLIELEIFDPATDLLAPLDRGWDRAALSDALVTVVGLGSIGAAACEALAAYGVRRFALVDPDRLHGHNFARHRVLRREHGRFKVRAVRDLLHARDLGLEIEVVEAGVGEQADEMRPLFAASSLIVCCADGAPARRVSSHLAFWAERPIILGCVLHFGAYGEVLRLLPGRTGCLSCNRAALEEVLNFEGQLDLDAYDERASAFSLLPGHTALQRSADRYLVNPGQWGTTAVTGDLHWVAGLVAKTAVATLMMRAGYRDQRPAGSHALMGLRPLFDAPKPFSFVDRVGAVSWRPTAAPRLDCCTCGEAVGW
jgi:molybdopterin/thiamine biosynthesis adenylyltransferase